MKDSLLEVDDDWRKVWREAGMPAYDQRDLSPVQSVEVRFPDLHAREAFARLVDQPLTPKTGWMWFPRVGYASWTDKNAPPRKVEPNRHPIYIVSKGRWRTRLTARQLDHLGIPYRIVVEPQERKDYASVLDPAKVLALPFSNLGRGSIPARNWIWEHSRKAGASRHWVLDDNIQGFFEMNHNQKPKIRDYNPFRLVEDFVDQFRNVGLAGMNYEFFAERRSVIPPYYLNTRIYSCILVRNDLPFRWRGRYNEDTDLSLRVLKHGLCTVLFNYCLAKKVTTMKMTGGNTDELYRKDLDFDGRLEMAKSLKAQHPGLVKITRKWGRWQHHVDYSGFRRLRLIRK